MDCGCSWLSELELEDAGGIEISRIVEDRRLLPLLLLAKLETETAPLG